MTEQFATAEEYREFHAADLARQQRAAQVPAPAGHREGVVSALVDGDVFSVDGGETWYVFAVHGFGTVLVYIGPRRDEDAPGVRVDADDDDACLIGVPPA